MAVDASRILGFATLAPRHIDIEGLPERVRGDCRGPLPALGLARLAVDRSAQNSGVGSQLLRLVLGLASKMAVEVDCAGVVVAAKPGVVEFYAKYGFVAFKPIEGQSEARPQPTAMWLPIQVIKKAGAPR